ncbi:MAG TPA: Crp/Fnr family transcriptional regulator [Chitinophagaceae bacterium]|nr:Crp/Fnr family transcriptional regulator [Chitinophagaceae bacterium]
MKKTEFSCNVKDCFLCSSCLPGWLGIIAQNKTNKYFSRGETIFSEGEAVKGIYFVYKGVVKVHKQWGKEKQLIIRFAASGDLLGHRGIGDSLEYPVSATVIQPVITCFIKTDFLNATIGIDHAFTVKLMTFYAKELQATEQRMHMLTHMDVKGRIAYNLLALKDQFGIDNRGYLGLPVNRQTLASFAGTTYESVFRVLNELVKTKCIQIKNKDIKILNEQLLLDFTKAS